jgi:hypothetical protein
MVNKGGDARRPSKIGVGQEIPTAGKFLDRRQDLHQRLLSIAQRGRQRCDTDTRLNCRERSQHAVVAVDYVRVRHRNRKPFGNPVVLHDAIEADHGVIGQSCDTLRTTVLLNVSLACIDRPDGIADLPTDQSFVGRFPRAEGYICFSLREVEVPIAGDEFDREVRILFVEAIEQPGRCFSSSD